MFELTYRGVIDGQDRGDLVERLVAGEAAALGEAYDLHHAQVRAFARHLVGDSGVAEDVVQETFTELSRAMRGYHGGSSLRTFVIGIAYNRARHHLRAAARRRAAVERMANEPAPASPSPEISAQSRQLAEALRRALDELPIDQRVAFVLCELDEQSSVEAAQILRVPESTVRTRLFHAKRKLRAWFERRGLR